MNPSRMASLWFPKNNFALGFFSPGNSSYQFLGFWYVKLTKQTVVWVANRNDPINDSAGVLSINQFGNLVLHDSFNCLLWSANVSVQVTASSVAQLQDSRNLVLIQGNNKKVLWQSYDYLFSFFLKIFDLFLFCSVLILYMNCSIDLECFTLFRCGKFSFWDFGHGFGAF